MYQLSFTWKVNSIDNAAEKDALNKINNVKSEELLGLNNILEKELYELDSVVALDTITTDTSALYSFKEELLADHFH